MNCPKKVDGVCMVATKMARWSVMVIPPEESCLACSQEERPKDENQITCGLAVLNLIEKGVFSPEEFPRLKNCILSYGPLEDKPGTALARILLDIGIYGGGSCGCEAYVAKMDELGWKGCVDNKQEIIDHLKAQDKTWMDMLKVAAAGYFTVKSLVNQALVLSKPKYV